MPEVWQADGLAVGAADAADGLRVLGAPLGSPDFIKAFCDQRTEAEARLFEEVGTFVDHTRDVQLAFLLLKYCCATRSIHLARTVPPSVLNTHAQATDQKLQTLFAKLLSVHPDTLSDFQKELLHAPARYAGFGIRSLKTIAPAAFWGGFAAALPVLFERSPQVAEQLQQLQQDVEPGDQGEHVRELKDIDAELRRLGFSAPTWHDLAHGNAVEDSDEAEEADPGEWKRGWQYKASNTLHKTQYETHLSLQNPTTVAKLRSQAGTAAAMWLDALPITQCFKIPANLFCTGLRMRAFLPLPLQERVCPAGRCNFELDEFGYHLLACPVLGRKKWRCIPLEKAFVQIYKEAGGSAKHNVPIDRLQARGLVRGDQRRLDGVGWGLPILAGLPIVMDATIRSPLTGAGLPAPGSDRKDGATFPKARYDKNRAYPELHDSPACTFLTLACETGGRWSQEVSDLVGALTTYKSEQCSRALQKSTKLLYTRRFWQLLSVAAMKGITASVEGLGEIEDSGAFLQMPHFEEVLAGVDLPPEVSRLA